MGLTDIATASACSSDLSLRKTSIESKEESSPEVECISSPARFEPWAEKPRFNQFFETAFQRQMMPLFASGNILTGSAQFLREQLQRRTRLYLESIFEASGGTLPLLTQNNITSPPLNDNHFNLSLLADVAFAHSTNEAPYDNNNKQQALDYSRKSDCSPSSIVKCKRIRNNEACRKSRLRRKLLNEAAKEKLASLARDNNYLKGRIFTLQEEIKATKDTLLSRIRAHPHYGQNPELTFASLWYACEEITKTIQREQEKGIIPDTQLK